MGMHKQMTQLRQIVQVLDPQLYAYFISFNNLFLRNFT